MFIRKIRLVVTIFLLLAKPVLHMPRNNMGYIVQTYFSGVYTYYRQVTSHSNKMKSQGYIIHEYLAVQHHLTFAKLPTQKVFFAHVKFIENVTAHTLLLHENETN